MKELIELLNEYKETKKIRNYDMDGQLEIDNAIYVNYPNIERLCGKQFGFIQRLIDNDKIDLKKLDETERKPMYVTDDMFSLYKVDECVIMLLSIQDNPIEFLVSILK